MSDNPEAVPEYPDTRVFVFFQSQSYVLFPHFFDDTTLDFLDGLHVEESFRVYFLNG